MIAGGGRAPRGRGAGGNPANRFVRLEIVPDPDAPPSDAGAPTEFYDDHSRSIISTNHSPDVGFDKSVNPYRGCEHGCIYCYARPTHEYLGFSAGLDFETKIIVKRNAAALLRKALSSPRWDPQPVALSGNTDPYQPVEKRMRLTRGCLEVLAEFRNPVIVITKNHLVTRDIDHLGALAADRAAVAFISITTLDRDLARVMEPRTSSPEKRLEAIETLTRVGIPTGVFVAPVIPGLTDHEMPKIMEMARAAGATHAAYLLVRLPHGVSALFEAWLDQHRPQHRDKVLNRIRSLRGGRLSDPRFGTRHRGTGPFAAQLRDMFRLSCRRTGINARRPELSVECFRRGDGAQGRLGL